MGFAPRSEDKKSTGLKNGLRLTHSKAQGVGLWAFVPLDEPRVRFFKHRFRFKKDGNIARISMDPSHTPSFERTVKPP